MVQVDRRTDGWQQRTMWPPMRGPRNNYHLREVYADTFGLSYSINVSYYRTSTISIRPHRSTTYVDAAYCYRLSSVVCLSVCLSVCHSSEPCKEVEPIEMPFEIWTWVGPRKRVLDGDWGAHWHHLANTINRPCAAAMPLLWNYFDHLLLFAPLHLTCFRKRKFFLYARMQSVHLSASIGPWAIIRLHRCTTYVHSEP